LAAEKGGRVVELKVEKGDRVEAGQLLLRVDNRKWHDYLKQAEVESREAEKAYARFEELRKTGAVSDTDFDNVMRRRDLAAATLDEAMVNVEQCDVVSPFSGIVDDRYIELGEFANEGARVLEVVDIDTVKVVVDVPEQDVLSLEEGLEMGFVVGAYPDRTFTGKVRFVSVATRPGRNSFQAEILAENSERELRGGMIATVRVVRGVVKDAVVVPLTAVVPQRGDHVVYAVSGDRARQRIVRIDRIVGGEAVISSGLQAGEKVVIAGQRRLHDGELIKIVVPDTDPQESEK
jgi:membrane fusion protein (multidrug efflux system)